LENTNSTIASDVSGSPSTGDEASGDHPASTNDDSPQSRRKRSDQFSRLSASSLDPPDEVDRKNRQKIGEIHELFHAGISEGELPHQSSRYGTTFFL